MTSDRTAERLAWLLAGAFPVARSHAALTLDMDANWDLRNYHLYNGFAWVEDRDRIDLLAAQRPAFYNPTLDIPLWLAVEHLPARAVGFGLGFVQGLNATLLLALGWVVLAGLAPWPRLGLAALAALVGMTGATGIGLLGTTFGDNLVSVPVLAAWLLLAHRHRALVDGPARPALARALAAGLLAGIAAGLKQPSALWGVGIGAALVLPPWPPARRLGLGAAFSVGAIAGVALSGGWWMARLWAEWGNPLMPYFNDVFQSPLAELKSYRDVKFLAPTLGERLVYPFAFTFDPLRVSEVAFTDGRVLTAFLATPLGLLALAAGGTRRREADGDAARFLLVACGVGYLAWTLLFGIYRYLAPLEMAAPLLVVAALALVPAAGRARWAACLAVLATLVATTRPPDWGRVPWAERMLALDVPTTAPGTMILLAGYEPLSFTIPAFPRDIPFIRVQSNFVQPLEVSNGTTALIARRVRAHQGPIEVMYAAWQGWHARQGLAVLGLEQDMAACRPITGTLVVEPIVLCPVSPAGPIAGP